MTTVVDVLARLRADASDMVNGFRDASGGLDGMQQGLHNAGQSTQNAGKAMSKNVTAPLVGIATAAVMTGVKFDDQMARVQAISGATGGDFDKLRQQAQDLGSSTRFSASEAAEGMEFLALAGFGANETMSAMPGLLDLASAGAMDLGRASDIVSDTMSAFKLDADQAGAAADIFANQSANSNTSVEQLGQAMSLAAPSAASLGMDLADTSAMLGVFADAGIKGSRGGTTLDAMLRDMVGSAEDGAIAIGDTSIALFDAEGNMRNMGDITGELAGATKDMSDEQREAALRSVFTSQAMRGVNLMMGDGADTMAEYAAANRDSAGAAGEMAATMEDTLGGAFREMRSALEGILIQMSDELVPIIRDTVVPAVQRFGDFIKTLLERFAALPGPVKRMAVMFLGLVAAIGPVLVIAGTLMKVMAAGIGVFAKVVKVVGLVGKAFAIVGKLLLANPIVLVIAAIIGAIVLLWKHSETFRNIVTAVWEAIKKAVKAVADWFMGTLVPALKKAWDRVRVGMMALWVIVKQVWSGIRDAIATAVEWFQTHVAPVFSAVGDLIGAVFGKIGDDSREAWSMVKTLWETFGQPTLERIQDVFRITWEGIKAVWETIGEPVMSIIGTVWEHMKDTAQVVWNVIRTVVETVMGAIANVIQLVTAIIQGDWSAAWTAIKDLFSGVWEGIKEVFTLVGEWLARSMERMMSVVGDLWEAGWGLVKQVLAAARDWVVQLIIGWVATVVGKFIELRDNVVATVERLRDRAVEVVVSLVSQAVSWFLDLKDRALALVDWLRNDSIEAMENMRDKVVDAVLWMRDKAYDAVMWLVDNVIAGFMFLVDNVIAGAKEVRDFVIRAFEWLRDDGIAAVQALRDGAVERFLALVDWVKGLPQRLLDALGDIGSIFADAGRRLIGGLADGITGGFRRARDAMSEGLSGLRNYLPFSPAKTGPFAGRGWSMYSGMSIAEDLAKGIDRSSQDAVRAAHAMANRTADAASVSPTARVGAGVGSGGGNNGGDGGGMGGGGDRTYQFIVNVNGDGNGNRRAHDIVGEMRKMALLHDPFGGS